MNHWTLTFRAEGDGPPVEIRVRRLLKAALRTYGLRCVDFRADDTLPDPHQDERYRGAGIRRPMTRHNAVWRLRAGETKASLQALWITEVRPRLNENPPHDTDYDGVSNRRMQP